MQRTNNSLNNILKLRQNLLHKQNVEAGESDTLQNIIDGVVTSLRNNINQVNGKVEVDLDGVGNEKFSLNVLVGLPVVLAAVGLHAWIQTRQRQVPVALPSRQPVTSRS